MSNMIKLDIFEIQDAIYNNPNIAARKFIKNNICVIGFKSTRLLVVNGVKYKNAVGFSIDANKKQLQVNYGINRTVNTALQSVNKCTITKEWTSIIVNII